MTVGRVGAAFVSDTSHAGATSIVSGERYRLEVAPVGGDLQYLHVSADYRRYVMPSPFYTIAARAFHIGRYGSGADDSRIAPFYLGYPWFVRGFDPGWSAVNECVRILSTGCPELDDLLGSRLAVGNVELRFPLLRPVGLSRSMYGPVPVEVAVFADGGVAWQSLRAPRRPIWSTGVTLRTSLLGFGLGQFDIARPVGPTAPGGWTVRFTLAPAF
jgi:outer membrane protein assembly factor BamA